MNTAELIASLKETIEEYQHRLDHYSDQVFTTKPSPDSWSMAEVYSHVLGANLRGLKAVEYCVKGKAEPTAVGLNELGQKLFDIGSFPPGKYDAPDALKAVVENIHKEEAKALVAKNLQRIFEIQGVDEANPDYKIEHPRLGFLTAPQWVKFVLIHSNHHLEQLNRIERGFSMC